MIGGDSKGGVLHKGLECQAYSAPTIPTEIFGTVFRKSRLSGGDSRLAAASASLSLPLSLLLPLSLPLSLSLLLPLTLLISFASTNLVSSLSGSLSLGQCFFCCS